MRITANLYIITVLLGLIFSGGASAGVVDSLVFTAKGEHAKLSLTIQGKNTPTVFALEDANPRIVIDIANTDLAPSVLEKVNKIGVIGDRSMIKRLRYAARGQHGIRLVADLANNASYQSHIFKDGMLTVYMSAKVKIPQSAKRIINGTPHPKLKTIVPISMKRTIKAVRSGIPVPRLKKSKSRIQHKIREKPLIVIDPGHGGRDPGSIGISKVKEETVTLRAALELRKQLLKTGKYNVVLTRETDRYIAHEKRVRIARKAGAELFISLHADSLGNSVTRGASVYTLAARAHKRGQNLVNTQNWILDVDLAKQTAPVSDILVDLAQRKTLSKSGEFADVLISRLKPKTILLGNTHREAGLYVLLAPDVPAVLLEMGFLSNKKDEALLNTHAHRKKLMKAVTKAINDYFSAQTSLHASR